MSDPLFDLSTLDAVDWLQESTVLLSVPRAMVHPAARSAGMGGLTPRLPGSPEVPEPLANQLSIGGRMLVPVGSLQSQRLLLVRRGESGFTEEEVVFFRLRPHWTTVYAPDFAELTAQ